MRQRLQTLNDSSHPTVVLIDRKGTSQEPLAGIATGAKLRPKIDALLSQ
ncbi:MAG TPA: hypothetical protein VIM45_03105 [Dehalococcoidia bacterium]|jgi:hypothetical protein